MNELHNQLVSIAVARMWSVNALAIAVMILVLGFGVYEQERQDRAVEIEGRV